MGYTGGATLKTCCYLNLDSKNTSEVEHRWYIPYPLSRPLQLTCEHQLKRLGALEVRGGG
jgi:hypothetical protein